MTAAVWLAVAVVCVVAGLVLLVVDRRRQRAWTVVVPAQRDTEPEDLFTPHQSPGTPTTEKRSGSRDHR